MIRPQPLQGFLDAVIPVLRHRARDGDSPASVERIAQAAARPGQAGSSPAALPVCRWFAQAAAHHPDDPDLAAVFAALRDLYPLMVWRRRTGDATASPGFSEAHANAMLLGPGGIEDRRDFWLGVSLLAPQTRYPDHHHAPEETYLVLSPGEFRRDHGNWFEPGVGGSFFVPPDTLHAMRSGDAPLFAIWALWAR